MIIYLRDLDFSLSEIKDILENYEDETDILDYLEQKKLEIEEKIHKYKAISFSLEDIITRERDIKMTLKNNEFDIEEKTLDTILVASIRTKGEYHEIGKLFSRIAKKMGQNINGKAMALYYDGEYKETDADFEACMPVKKGREMGNIKIGELPGGRCVALIHKGLYSELGRSYNKIINYLKGKGYNFQLPTREIYLKGPGLILKGNPNNYLTEIQMMIEE